MLWEIPTHTDVIGTEWAMVIGTCFTVGDGVVFGKEIIPSLPCAKKKFIFS